MMMEEEYKKVYYKVSKYCSSAERSRYDVIQKLVRMGVEEDVHSRLLQQLEEEKYLDEQRFAGAFAKDKMRFNGWGPQKIYYALKHKQIDCHLIDEAIRQLYDEENEVTPLDKLKQLVKNKLNSIKEPDPVKRFAKVVRFATNKGYSYSDVKETINLLDKECGQLE
ncbi:MAG: regulatory protein RecX [Porphyromonadaceae bacterium]|nr:regulatory protein RecX [Porphyromonadaceae bacterium]